MTYLLGIPRHRIGRAFRSALALPYHALTRKRGQAFADELAIWDLLGFIYGKRFIQIEKFYADARA